MRVLVVVLVAACSREPSPTAARTEEVAETDRGRAAALIGELKKSLLGAVTAAMANGPAAAIDACHAEAPALTAAVSREGAVVGRATRKPRNPRNAATGWQLDALVQFEAAMKAGTPLAGQRFARRLPDGRVAYAEPLAIQEVCLVCHGAAVSGDVTAILAEKYPGDQATGYALGDLRGVAWAELPPLTSGSGRASSSR